MPAYPPVDLRHCVWRFAAEEIGVCDVPRSYLAALLVQVQSGMFQRRVWGGRGSPGVFLSVLQGCMWLAVAFSLVNVSTHCGSRCLAREIELAQSLPLSTFRHPLDNSPFCSLPMTLVTWSAARTTRPDNRTTPERIATEQWNPR